MKGKYEVREADDGSYYYVLVASNGSMKGDIIAPRVVLADGARFKGTVDMERKGAPQQPAATLPPQPKPQQQPAMSEMREPVKA